MIPNRKPSNSKGSKRHFSKTAQKTHPRNLMNKPMRGGIRL